MNRKMTFNKAALLLLVMLFMCSMSMVAKDKMVQRGMTKEQVMDAIGKPDAVSFDTIGETWTYIKTPLVDYNKMILVVFDKMNRVDSYREQILLSKKDGVDMMPPAVVQPMPQGYPPYPYPDVMPYSMSDDEFALLARKVKSASFDDNKFDLLEVATIGCYYTCAQCARLMKTFSFDDSRLRALRIMAPHIVDPQNVSQITVLLTFSDNKDRALQMLQR